jgi:hypothetical protein
LNAALWRAVDVWNYIAENNHLEWYRGDDQMLGNQIRETGCGLNIFWVSVFMLELSYMLPGRLVSDL